MATSSGRGVPQERRNSFNCPNCSVLVAVGHRECPNCGVSLANVDPNSVPKPVTQGQPSTPPTGTRPVPRNRNSAPPIAKGTLDQPGSSKVDTKKKGTSRAAKKKSGYWSKLDRAEIRRIKIYVFAVQIVAIVIFMLNAMYESFITADKFYLPSGFYLPIGYLLLLILFLVFILSTEGLWFKYIQIKIARSFEKRSKLIKDYRGTAQGVLVTSLVVLIVVFSLSFLPFIGDALKTEDTFELGNTDEGKENYFETQDALGLTYTNSISIDSNRTVELAVGIQEISKENDEGEIDFKNYGNHTNKDISLSSPDYQLGYSPNEKVYFYITNVGNESVSAKVIIEREISKQFVFNIALFMILFIATSAAWLGYLSAARKKYDELHEEKVEQLTKHYAVKPYTIEDVFIIYLDGTLINHQTRRIKPMDNDILSGMLTAIKDFVADAFKNESKGELNELKYGKLKILIEHGEFSFIAMVVSGKSPRKLRVRMKQVITQINKQFYKVLKNYKGDLRQLAGVKHIVNQQLLGVEDADTNFDETSDSAWNNKGVVLTKLGKYNEALDSFDNALKINPGVSNIWLNRGIALVKLSEFEEAMDCFDRALQLDPNNDSAKRRRNKCWYKWQLLDGREAQLTGRGRSRGDGRARQAPADDYGNDYDDRPAPRQRSQPQHEFIGGGAVSPSPAPGIGIAGGGHYGGAGTGAGVAAGSRAGAVDEPKPRCPSCGQPLQYVETHESWYCSQCDSYPYDE